MASGIFENIIDERFRSVYQGIIHPHKRSHMKF